PLEQKGVIDKLAQGHDEGNQNEIYVHPAGSALFPQAVQVSDVLLAGAAAKLFDRLKEELNSPELAQQMFYWIMPKLAPPLVPTLTLDVEATKAAQEEAVKKVPDQFKLYLKDSLVKKANSPLVHDDLDLLKLEHETYVNSLTTAEVVTRSLA